MGMDIIDIDEFKSPAEIVELIDKVSFAIQESKENIHELKNQGFFKRMFGALTGGTQKQLLNIIEKQNDTMGFFIQLVQMGIALNASNREFLTETINGLQMKMNHSNDISMRLMKQAAKMFQEQKYILDEQNRIKQEQLAARERDLEHDRRLEKLEKKRGNIFGIIIVLIIVIVVILFAFLMMTKKSTHEVRVVEKVTQTVPKEASSKQTSTQKTSPVESQAVQNTTVPAQQKSSQVTQTQPQTAPAQRSAASVVSQPQKSVVTQQPKPVQQQQVAPKPTAQAPVVQAAPATPQIVSTITTISCDSNGIKRGMKSSDNGSQNTSAILKTLFVYMGNNGYLTAHAKNEFIDSIQFSRPMSQDYNNYSLTITSQSNNVIIVKGKVSTLNGSSGLDATLLQNSDGSYTVKSASLD